MRRTVRIIAIAAAGLVAVLIAALLAVQVRPVQNGLAGWLSDLASSPDLRITLDDVGGSLPFGPRIGRLVLGDAVGPWAVVEDAALDLDGAALLTGRIHVQRLVAARLRLLRLPGPATEPAPPPSGPLFEIPSLPKGLAVDRLEIGAIDIDPAVAGRPARLRLDGRLGVDPATGRAAVRLSVLPSEGSTRLVLDASHDPADDRLALDLALDEEPGGPLARIAGLGEAAAIHLALRGAGPVDGFNATLSVEAGGAKAAGTLALARNGGGDRAALGVTARATLDPGDLVPAAYRAALGNQVALALAADLTDQAVAIRDLVLETPPVTLKAEGQVIDGGVGTLTAEFAIDPDALASAFPDLAAIPDGMRPRRLGLDVTLDADFSVATIARLDATAPGVTLNGTGHLADGFNRVAADVTATVSDLGLVPELGLQGQGRLTMTVNGTVADRKLTVTAAADGTEVAGADPVAGLLGPGPRLALSGALDGGAVTLSDLTVAAAGLDLKASGTADLDQQTVDLSFDGTMADLARLGRGYGGAVAMTGRASGPLAAPTLDLDMSGTKVVAAGQALGAPRLSLQAAPAAGGGATGDVRLTAGGTWPLDLRSGLTVAPGQVTLSGLAANALGLTVTGDVAYGLDDGLARGRVVVAGRDLSGLSTLAGTALSGQLDAVVTLMERGGVQGLDGKLSGSDLRYDTLSIGRAEIVAKLDDLLGAGRGRVSLQAGAGAAGTARIETLDITVDLESFDAMTARLAAESTSPAPVRLEATARLILAGAAPRMTVETLDGRVADRPLRLAQPAVLVLGSVPTLADLDLHFGDGRVAGNLALGARPKGLLTINNLALADFRPFAGPRLPAGQVDGTLSVDGGAGHLDIALTKVQPGADQDLVIAARDLAPLGLNARIDWAGDTAKVTAGVSGIADSTLGLSGTVPIATASGLPLPREDGQMDLALAVDADLARISALLPVGETRARGRITVDATARGSLAAPRLAGRAEIAKGRVDNGTTGLSLRDLDLAASFDGDRLSIDRLTAGDGDGGTVALSGSVRLGLDPRVDTRLQARKFRFTGLEILTTRGDADLTLAGPLDDLRLDGALTLRQGNVEITASLPPSVPEVAVRDPDKAPEPVVPQRTREGLVSLALTIDVPGQFYVRGRGLDSEWRGKLTVGGTSVTPEVNGGLEVVRGTFTLAGRDFRIEEGSLTFPSGLKAPPQLLVDASAPTDDITAKVTVAGPANAVKITLSSEPALPSDEVLSRVLFGSSVSNLTASQAVRLAETALELSGRGGSGVLGSVRDTLGLDRLDIGSGGAPPDETETEADGKSAGALAGTSLSAGRYIADGVFLGFEQGMTPDSSAVTVEVEIYPRVTIEGSVGAPSKTGAGLNYKFDY